MFSKNPYLMPLIGLAVLVTLFIFQRQQQKLAVSLKAAAQMETKTKARPEVRFRLNDPVYGPGEAELARCNGTVTGRTVSVREPMGEGFAEFDFTALREKSEGTIALFALTVSGTPSCVESLLEKAPLGIFLNLPGKTLTFNARTSKGREANTLKDTLSALPARLRVEWASDSVRFFLNGRSAAAFGPMADPFAQGGLLFVGQADTVLNAPGVEIRSFQAGFPPPAKVHLVQ